jgi:hypothetical protein
MPNWEPIDPQLHQWVAEGINPGEMCRRLGWDLTKRQTVVDRLRKLGLKAPAKPKATGESRTSNEPVEVLPGQMSLEPSVSAVTDIAPMSESLSPAEVKTLAHYEEIVEQGREVFIQVGQALLAIRDQRLYRESYSTFEDYLRQRWDLSRSYAHRMIDAAVVVQNLLPIGNIVPVNEAQARPLTTLSPEQQAEVWNEAVKTAPAGKVTAKHVQTTVKRLKERTTPQPPKVPEPQPRRPARMVVQEGLVWGLREVSDEDAWPILAWIWDLLSDHAKQYESLRGMLVRVYRRLPETHRPHNILAAEPGIAHSSGA